MTEEVLGVLTQRETGEKEEISSTSTRRWQKRLWINPRQRLLPNGKKPYQKESADDT